MAESHIVSNRANQFWKFSLRTYRRAPVKQCLLALQQCYGANINIVLFCCWFAHSGQGKLSSVQLQRAMELLFTWHDNITCVLRKLRETLPRKSADPHYQKLCEIVLQDEIQAEKAEQTMLAEHIFYPSETCSHEQQVNNATVAVQIYLDLLTVPGSDKRNRQVDNLMTSIFNESTTYESSGTY